MGYWVYLTRIRGLTQGKGASRKVQCLVTAVHAGALSTAVGSAVNAARFSSREGSWCAEVDAGACSGLHVSETVFGDANATICAAAWSSCARVDDLDIIAARDWW